MIFVDTSHLLALALPRDSLHAVAVAWSRRVSEPLLTTSYVICEFVNGMSSPAMRSRAHGILSLLFSANDFHLLTDASEPLLADGLDLHRQRLTRNGRLPIAFPSSSCSGTARGKH